MMTVRDNHGERPQAVLLAEPVEATALVAAPPAEVFEFLSQLENHWRLADRWIEVREFFEGAVEGGGGTPTAGGAVRMRGPLGIGRTARTLVLSADPPHSMSGIAEVGERTRARVTWTLAPEGGGTRVTLAAGLERAGVLDRLMLLLGGRIWLARRFRSVLELLAARFDAAAGR
jgi:uncharacterized protein YndB with AHSA1/START domain